MQLMQTSQKVDVSRRLKRSAYASRHNKLISRTKRRHKRRKRLSILTRSHNITVPRNNRSNRNNIRPNRSINRNRTNLNQLIIPNSTRRPARNLSRRIMPKRHHPQSHPRSTSKTMGSTNITSYSIIMTRPMTHRYAKLRILSRSVNTLNRHLDAVPIAHINRIRNSQSLTTIRPNRMHQLSI